MTDWLHPLHKHIFTEKEYAFILKYNEDVKNRSTGKSTIAALRLIAQCLHNPGIFYRIQDHGGTDRSHQNLESLIKESVTRLELKGFEFRNESDCLFVRFK